MKTALFVVLLSVIPVATADFEIKFQMQIMQIPRGFCLSNYSGEKRHGWGTNKTAFVGYDAKNAVITAQLAASDSCNNHTTACRHDFTICRF